MANATSATFLRVVGSELVKKHVGEGPQLVREIFRTAEENAPAILFIDEVDAIGARRDPSGAAASGAQKEVYRTMIELLSQLDGFDSHSGVRVIMATNRIGALDPALIRPGRIDRKIEFTLPDEASLKKIFCIHSRKMTLAPDVDPDRVVIGPAGGRAGVTGADIKAICTEAGLLALRDRRTQVTLADFVAAKDKVIRSDRDEGGHRNMYL